MYLKMADGIIISIYCTAVENEVADNMYRRSELDWLIYDDSVEYTELILNGDPEIYLKTVTEYKHLDSWAHSAYGEILRMVFVSFLYKSLTSFV